jgi:predicted TIM-barrel fold metal-dependent hydrolase
VRIVDSNTHFGRRANDSLDVSLSALLGEVRTHRISAALTHSLRGVSRLAADANQETFAATEQSRDLVPVATVDPRDYPAWRLELDRCLARGIRVFRIFPAEQRWSIDSEPFVEIVRRLAGRGAVLIVSASAWGTASAIGRMTAGLDLTVVLADVHYTQMAEAMVALDRWPHLQALTNRLATTGAVEMMARAVGAERMLYGSEAPTRPMQCALNSVWFARVSEAERAAIFAVNADRLIGASVRAERSDAAPPPLPGVRITDVHAHVGRFPFPAGWVDEVLELERLRQVFNLGEVLVSSTDAIAYDTVAGNRVVADLLSSHAWLRGYVVVNPRDRAGAIAELDRWAGRQGFVGVKVHAEYSAVPTASQPMADLFAEIAKRARVVKIHNSGPDWAGALADFARAWRSLNIVIAHAGPGQASGEAIHLAHTEPNVLSRVLHDVSSAGRHSRSHPSGRRRQGPLRQRSTTDRSGVCTGRLPGCASHRHGVAGGRQREPSQSVRSLIGLIARIVGIPALTHPSVILAALHDLADSA